MKGKEFKESCKRFISTLSDDADVKIGSNGVVERLVSYDIYSTDDGGDEIVFWGESSDPETET